METHGNISKKKGFESAISNTQLDYIVEKLENLFFATKVIQALQDEGVYKNTGLWDDIKELLDGKVDSESGKTLSSNDFTDEEKSKLTNAITNIGTLFDMLEEKAGSDELISGLANKVDTSVYNAKITELVNSIAQKQDNFIFDDTPTEDSEKPVTSGGIKTALDEKLSLSGGTMQGTLVTGNHPVVSTLIPSANFHLTNKEYVDTQINNKLSNVYRAAGSISATDIRTDWSAKPPVYGTVYILQNGTTDDLNYYFTKIDKSKFSFKSSGTSFYLQCNNFPSFYFDGAEVTFTMQDGSQKTGSCTLNSLTTIIVTLTQDTMTSSDWNNVSEIKFKIFYEANAGDNLVWIEPNIWDNLGNVTDLSNYQEKLTFDTTPTEGSTNPVTSDGIKSALNEKVDKKENFGLVKADILGEGKEKSVVFEFENGKQTDTIPNIQAVYYLIDTKIINKANSSDVYTKTEIDTMIGDVETAADNIIALQEGYIGGGTA